MCNEYALYDFLKEIKLHLRNDKQMNGKSILTFNDGYYILQRAYETVTLTKNKESFPIDFRYKSGEKYKEKNWR